MDDSGVSDAFYTVLSIGIVLIAAIAISGVVLSATMKQGEEAGAEMAGYGTNGGMMKGLYCFYYAIDRANSDYLSGDPDEIALQRLAVENTVDAIDFNRSAAPQNAPGQMGVVLWSGYLYAPAQGSYAFELRSAGEAWLWVDGNMAANNSRPTSQAKAFTLQLAKGYHPLKAKYFYADMNAASCSLYWSQGSQPVLVKSFRR